MSTKSKIFSIGDYIWRRAFDSKTSDRGKWERDIVQSHIRGDNTDLVTPFSTRALTAGTATAGGNLIADSASDSPAFQNFYSPSFFMSQATILDGLESDVTLDAKITDSVLTSNAVAENVANPLSTEPALGNYKLSPTFIRTSIDLSVTLLEQSSKGIDNLIVSEISAKLSSTLDHEIMFGLGGDTMTGITTITGVANTAWGTLANLSGDEAFEGIIAAEKGLGNAKIPNNGDYFFLLNSTTREILRKERWNRFALPILSDENQIIGIDAIQNENLRDADVFLIAPKNVVLGLWHDRERFDILVDSWTKGNQGLVSLTVSVIADVKLIKTAALYTLTEV